MADIRESFNDAVGSGVGHAHSPLARARATSSDRMSDQIAAEKRGELLREEQKAAASAAGLPVWVLNIQKDIKGLSSWKAPLTLSVKVNGDLYYRDGIGCKVELPSSAKQFKNSDGMLLSEFLAEIVQ